MTNSFWETIYVARFKAAVNRLIRGEEGATMVEYALMVALIAIFCIAAVGLLGGQLSTTFSNVSGSL
jgi:pilus assembly protein Flp/PilA